MGLHSICVSDIHDGCVNNPPTVDAGTGDESWQAPAPIQMLSLVHLISHMPIDGVALSRQVFCKSVISGAGHSPRRTGVSV